MRELPITMCDCRHTCGNPVCAHDGNCDSCAHTPTGEET